MADDLDENFEISEEFIPEPRPLDVYEEIQNVNESEKVNGNDGTNSENVKSRNKRKNITEILELRKDELSKASYATNEFKKILIDYANKTLCSVEKNELNLSDDISKRIQKMILKRKKIHQLDVDLQFKKKLSKKIKLNKKSAKARSAESKRSPYVIILAQSAVRCIELQKKIANSMPTLFESINWVYAFAKHKKLNDQISFINSKFTRDPEYSLDMVLATPQRLNQLFDAGCISPNSTAYVFIDYSFRDIKLKRIIDHEEIRVDFCKLAFKHFLPRNQEKIKLKFYLA